jgi:8-oxo-dGTP pyrophosphatase MutT (NUDIX family)
VDEPVHTDTERITTEKQNDGSTMAGEDAEVVLDDVLQDNTVVEPVLGEHAKEVSKEVSEDVDVEEEFGPDDESALDELLASREETDIRSPVVDDMDKHGHTDSAMEQRYAGSADADEDAEAVQHHESVLQDNTVVEPVLGEHGEEVSNEVSPDVDTEEELGIDDESALDELLASRDDSEGQSPLESGNDEGQSKQASMDVEEVLEDIIADAVVEELLASVDDASSHASAKNEDTSAHPRSQEVAAENVSGLMENLIVDESALKLFEETDGDTSGFNSEYNKADESLLEQDDHSELHNVSVIYPASSKDTTDDVSQSEVIAQFIKSGSNDETGYIVPEGSKANSLASSDTGTDSSNETAQRGCAPSAGSTDKPAATSPGAKVEVDYKSVDYRGFVFVVHKTYGLMLLHCTRKKKKGPHFQLPGGHIDEPEFFAAAEESRDGQTQLLLASRAGAARELYEETGMDVRYQLDRMEPAALRDEGEVDKHGKPLLQNELKHRLYFFLPVTDDDFWSSDKGDSDAGKMHPMGAALGCEGSQLMVSRWMVSFASFFATYLFEC